MNNIVLNTKVEFKSSYEWLHNGFRIFREAPIQFIILTIFSGLLSFAPVLGAFLAPFFTARFAILANAIECGQKIRIGDIFTEIFSNRKLVQLAYMNVLFGLIIMLGEHYAGGESLLIDLSINGILFLFSILIIQTFFWLSPIICEYNRDIKIIDAMLLSFKASLYNAGTMILYAIIIVAFTILSIIPVGLGFFILLPVINISNYFIYKNVFIIRNSELQF